MNSSSSTTSFSSAVVLSDLNDYLSLELNCIKPTKNQEKSMEIAVEKEDEKIVESNVEINLSDCLACSGCITSAESVLVAVQSNKELYRILEENQEKRKRIGQDQDHQDVGMDVEGDLPRIVVVSLSSQSRASLANKFQFASMQEIWNALYNLFVSHLGVDHVVDIDFARDISLMASGCEFIERFQKGQQLPVLTSACPGWICYAEKTHPNIIPHLDSTKSPQQIMGSIVKDFMAKQLQVTPSQIYHVSIMPCYDKKLEASRTDFCSEINASRDVDLVLSTIEVEQILVDMKIDIHQIPKTSMLQQPTFPVIKKNILSPSSSIKNITTDGAPSNRGGASNSSGGYLEWVLSYAVKSLYNHNITVHDIRNGLNGITITPGRNNDFTTITYTPPPHQDVQAGLAPSSLVFAYVYGFKNIQNLVRKLKLKAKTGSSPPFHFVEVMACPRGCINGGAQSRQDAAVLPSKEWIQAVEDMYVGDGGVVYASDGMDEGVDRLLSAWIGSDYATQMQGCYNGIIDLPSSSTAVQHLFRTAFHAVDNSSFVNPNAGLTVKW